MAIDIGKQHLLELMKALGEARARHTLNKPWIMALGIVLSSAIFWLVIGAELGREYPLIRNGSLILIVIVSAVIAAWETRVLAAYEKQVVKRFEHSGIVEKLAIGWDQLPDIYSYTPWPWRLFLGARPADLPGYARLVAFNLDWYLREPRTLIRAQWVVFLLLFAIVPLPFLKLVLTGAGLQPGVVASADQVISRIFGAIIVAVVLAAWAANHQQARQGIGARLLHDVFAERLRT